MRNLLGVSTLLLAAATLHAQLPSHGTILLVAPPSGENCPVGLSVNRLPDGGMARVTSRDEPQGPALHLTFEPVNARGIAHADLILHGSIGDHVLPTATKAAGDSTETFSVTPSSGANHRFSSVITLRKLTAVDYVEVKALTFADGTHWHASSTSTCRVAPSNLRLVAGR